MELPDVIHIEWFDTKSNGIHCLIESIGYFHFRYSFLLVSFVIHHFSSYWIDIWYPISTVEQCGFGPMVFPSNWRAFHVKNLVLLFLSCYFLSLVVGLCYWFYSPLICIQEGKTVVPPTFSKWTDSFLACKLGRIYITYPSHGLKWNGLSWRPHLLLIIPKSLKCFCVIVLQVSTIPSSLYFSIFFFL